MGKGFDWILLGARYQPRGADRHEVQFWIGHPHRPLRELIVLRLKLIEFFLREGHDHPDWFRRYKADVLGDLLIQCLGPGYDPVHVELVLLVESEKEVTATDLNNRGIGFCLGNSLPGEEEKDDKIYYSHPWKAHGVILR